ncbi:MAG: alanine racemase [Firmicutes bacterium]|nr:alanine racemase [Bacillota bacterium]
MITLKIDLGRLKHNLGQIKTKTNAKIYAVVKANAYGHGVEICKYITQSVYGFAVSNALEAAELIATGIKNPILILCPSGKKTDGNIIHTVCDLKGLDQLNSCKIALKINSGMNRLGLDHKQMPNVTDKLKSRPDLILTDIFTHFSCVESADTQLKIFKSATKNLKNSKEISFHACASNALVLNKNFHLDAIRCGLAMYGYPFGISCATAEINLKPVLKAYAKVLQINDVKRGSRVGYGSFFAPKNMTIAVISAGYADGFRRSQGRKVMIDGTACPVFSCVCMDMCLVDITHLKTPLKIGSKAYILDDSLCAMTLANELNTVPYEILTSFSSKRIIREYVDN